MIERRKARQIQVGTATIGGDAPVSIQSMTKTDTRDVQATVDQIWALEVAGCDIVRLGVPIREAAAAASPTMATSAATAGRSTSFTTSSTS